MKPVADPNICRHCGMTPDPKCNGNGQVWLGDDSQGPCKNKRVLYVRSYLKDHLGKGALAAGLAKNSPLLGRRDENLFIQAMWSTLLPHLSWVLLRPTEQKRLKVVTDEEIKDVFVGHYQYNMRPKGVRDDATVYNNLRDFLGPDVADLVIIKLGYLGYKNKSASGALREALLIRQNANKPTWLINDPDRKWNYSCDTAVEETINSYFSIVTIESDGSTPLLSEALPDPDDDFEEVEDGIDQEVTKATDAPKSSRPKSSPKPKIKFVRPEEPEEGPSDNDSVEALIGSSALGSKKKKGWY